MIARRAGSPVSRPAGRAQPPPRPVGGDGHETLIPSEMGRDSEAHAGMAPPGARGQKRQVALDVSTQVEKVRDQQDARRPFPDTRFDPRRNGGTGDSEE